MNALKNRKLNIQSILLVVATVVVSLAVCLIWFGRNIPETVALEQELRCGMEEHVHTDDCYDGDFQVCDRTAHTHDGNCYIVLLHENDINSILSLIDNSQNRSLESVITDVMSTALTFNSNLNTAEGTVLSPSTVAELNDTISDDDSLPDLVLNENLNTGSTLVPENTASFNAVTAGNGGVSTLAVGDEPSTATQTANFYVYLDDKWTCIGSLPFTTSRSGWRYSSTLPTGDLLELVNTTLGTEFTYQSFGVAAAASENGTYSTGNLSVGQATTTIGARQSSSTTAAATKYVRLIPRGDSATSTSLAFYTVTYAYLNGTTETRIVQGGTDFTLPGGGRMWSDRDTLYDAGSSVSVSQTTTFTERELTHIDIVYDVAFPTVSGVTVTTQPTLAGLTTDTATDGFDKAASAVIRNVSAHSVAGKVTGNSTGLSRVIQFKGWQVGDTDILLQPNTTLVWDELVQYATAGEIALTAVWEYDALQTATFFIRFDSVAVDTEGNITGQDQNLYTNELFSAYVGGVDTSLGSNALHTQYHIVDEKADNSYTADQTIRALYGEKADGVWLSAFPTDEYIFEELKQYAETGYLSVDGEPVKAEDLNSKAYAIRWYVFKCQSDAWHIDGKLVKKVGLIHAYKTFAGNKELVAEAKQDFYIDAHDITAGTHTTLDMTNYTSHDETTDTYMWEITNVDYGELWEITEHPHQFADSTIEFSTYSEYTVMDSHGDQSISGSGTSLTVTGMTYALDEGTDEVLRASFTNIYNKNDAIIIKKQDSRTGASIGGASFQLLQNGKTLAFTYDAAADRYIYDPAAGTETLLSGSANGYFEISIEDFSYDVGPITVREVTPPTGYTPIGDIEIGYTDDNKTVGILSGNSDLIQYISGILIVGNSTDAMSVTAKKAWDCPETEWQDVTVQLLANDKLVTTVIAGVEPQVVLNDDNNWTHTWDNLPVYVNGQKIEWSLKEIRIGTEQAKADDSFVNWLVSYELPIHSTDADGKENILLTVTNTTKRVMLRLTKTDLGKTLQLPGATFLLQAVDANGNVLTEEVAKSATTGDTGTLVFDNMKAGIRYRLAETAAPVGYLPLEEYIYFTINEDGSVTVEDSYYASAANTAYNILVRNAEGIPLPESGGTGFGMFYVAGLLLTIAALGIGIGILRKRRCPH